MAIRVQPEQVVAPVLGTQRNCEAVFGIDARRWLEQIVPLCKGHVTELGKLRAIPVAVVLERLRALASSDSAAVEPTIDTADDADFETPDQVLSRIGMRRSA